MMRIASLTMFLAAASLVSGCATASFRGSPIGTKRGAIIVKEEGSGSRKECHPSQYWDGESCKHKGKGKGARKHDGE